MNALVPVGKVTKLFGDNGEMVVTLYDSFPGDINREEPLYARVDSLTVPLFLYKFERRGKNGAVIGIDDFDTPGRAGILMGKELHLPLGENKTDQADDGQVYMEDFVGFRVCLKGYPHQGVVDAFIESQHNPLFSLAIEGREVLVPATDEFVVKYNLRRRELTLDIPEGLLELYL